MKWHSAEFAIANRMEVPSTGPHHLSIEENQNPNMLVLLLCLRESYSLPVLSVIICLSNSWGKQWSRNLSPMLSSSSREKLSESQVTILSGTQKTLPFWEWKSYPLIIVAVHSKRNLGICLTLVKLTYWPCYTILAETSTETSWIRNSHWFTFKMKYQWAVESFHILWDVL